MYKKKKKIIYQVSANIHTPYRLTTKTLNYESCFLMLENQNPLYIYKLLK